MSNMNTTANTASTTHLNKEYYDRQLLEGARTRLVFAKYGQKRSIPLNSGKTVEFRRWDLFDIGEDMCKLTEGVTPAGQTLSQSKVEATVDQYGAYVEISDLLEDTAYDLVASDSAELLGEQLGTVMDWVTRDAVCSGSNVQYAGGKMERSAVAATDVLTTTEVRKAVRTLKKAKARQFAGEGQRRPHYICICSPDATYDLQNDPLWQDVSKYSNAENIYSGEIGRIFGVVFVESTESRIEKAGGADGCDIHCSVIFGKDAYGVIDLEERGALQSIVKPRGSAGADDPLDQRSTVGAKVPAFAAKILNDTWIVRIEHGVSA